VKLRDKVHTVHNEISSQSLQKVRISNVMQKLNVKGRSQAVVELVRLGELKI
jgi:LuxR family transcriptional regulator, transcriptional regulator of spore coat protein